MLKIRKMDLACRYSPIEFYSAEITKTISDAIIRTTVFQKQNETLKKSVVWNKYTIWQWQKSSFRVLFWQSVYFEKSGMIENWCLIQDNEIKINDHFSHCFHESSQEQRVRMNLSECLGWRRIWVAVASDVTLQRVPVRWKMSVTIGLHLVGESLKPQNW